MARQWTAEERARQAELIRAWKPWTASTGPKTYQGKQASAANRQKSLDAADAELRVAREKVKRLHGGKEKQPDWMAAVLKAIRF